MVERGIVFDAHREEPHAAFFGEGRLIDDELAVAVEKTSPGRGVVPKLDGAAPLEAAAPIGQVGQPEKPDLFFGHPFGGRCQVARFGGLLETHLTVAGDAGIRMDRHPFNAQAFELAQRAGHDFAAPFAAMAGARDRHAAQKRTLGSEAAEHLVARGTVAQKQGVFGGRWHRERGEQRGHEGRQEDGRQGLAHGLPWGADEEKGSRLDVARPGGDSTLSP